MKFFADLHIHSKYSRATSPQMDLEHLDKAAQIKGVDVLSCGDFTHPAWFSELKNKLAPAEPGLYQLKSISNSEPAGEIFREYPQDDKNAHQGDRGVRFILTTEISCIYSKNGKVRKVHILIFAPDLETVEKINIRLGQIGNLKADGRPILGLDAKELAKIVLNINPDCLVVPAHCWTPWFAVFGSKSGFDSLEECFEDYTKYIYAVETGLSSDPKMNWRLSALDKVAFISCSDAHSAAKLAREACCFDTALSYGGVVSAIKSKDPKKFLFTIEFFPEEGKYHFDGHSDCKICFSPQETKKHKGVCPVCQRPLIVGVLNRVEQLADRPEGFTPVNAVPFKPLVPLQEILSEMSGVGVNSKQVAKQYEQIIKKFGPELSILLDLPVANLKDQGFLDLAQALQAMRQGNITVEPGYDGVYGKVSVFAQKNKKEKRALQQTLIC